MTNATTVDLELAETIFTMLASRELVVVVGTECRECRAEATELTDKGAPLCFDCAYDVPSTVTIEDFVVAVGDLFGVESGDVCWAPNVAYGLTV